MGTDEKDKASWTRGPSNAFNDSVDLVSLRAKLGGITEAELIAFGRYLFDIRTETTAERPGLPSWAIRKHSTGYVRPLVVGKAFPLGYYRLYTADGKILRVKNLGQAWAILAS